MNVIGWPSAGPPMVGPDGPSRGSNGRQAGIRDPSYEVRGIRCTVLYRMESVYINVEEVKGWCHRQSSVADFGKRGEFAAGPKSG